MSGKARKTHQRVIRLVGGGNGLRGEGREATNKSDDSLVVEMGGQVVVRGRWV